VRVYMFWECVCECVGVCVSVRVRSVSASECVGLVNVY
jgi:hypothetical protein